MRKPMVVHLPAQVWANLGLDDEQKKNVTTACFYLGYGLDETKRISRLGQDHRTVLDVLDIAIYSGLDFSIDNVILG